MRNGWWQAMRCLIVGGIVLPAAACGSGVPRPTNPAVQACETAAEKQGFGVLDQQTVMPIDQARYRIELSVTDKKGDRRVTCEWDPASGARIGDVR